MSRNSSNKKKSTSKYRKFKISPLIPVIAIIEVIVLIVISTYAWFVVSQEKEANTGIISVDADSGLDIDFKNATYNDHINLWDYVPDDFEFSPVTSLDGRNVFVPTSGTFGNDQTNNIKFREATINDINTKYVDVDFMLTNTNNVNVNVYLNNRSYFRVYDNNHKIDENEPIDNSRALRLAFYTNDAKHGNVSSSILENTKNEDAVLAKLENRCTVFFEKPSGWSDCNAYIWTGSNQPYIAWPGSAMTHVAGSVYSYTFSNKDNYSKVVFNNGSTGNDNQTADLTIVNGNLYKKSDSENSTGESYSTKTVYFMKPSDWTGVRAHAFKASNQPDSFTNYPGDECYYCGCDVYSYTFPTVYEGYSIDGIVFNNLANQNNKTLDLDAVDGRLYYFTAGGSNGACSFTNYTTKTVYLNNSEGWSKPYVKVKAPSGHEVRVAMTNLSAGIYYATFPGVYTQVGFEDRSGYNNETTQVTGTNKYTQYTAVTDGEIYRPNEWTSTGFTLTDFSYTGYVGTSGESTYAVISPGVSAGFQRAYTPVVGSAPNTGVPTQVVPAFACSLDNYIKSETNPAMFTIPAGGMLDLSMVVWLEGTDKDCTGENYAAKNIDIYFEFSTSFTDSTMGDVAVQNNYTYRFYDKTREVWTADRLSNDAGVSVAPVIQLYDDTAKRGYLMHAASTTNIGNTRKVDLWECSAPAELYTDDHDLYFRRVDPYNEDEVWNYWHPVRPKSGSGNTAMQNDVVSFTAFSDGAPASAGETGIAGNETPLDVKDGNGNTVNAGTPTQSCGGLWGKHTTALLTVIDGTNGNYIKNDKGVMTINYTYKYNKSSSTSQSIEYKASGSFFNQVYYFVVPTALYNSTDYASSFSFKRFYDFDKEYAMNIKHRNDTMKYDSGAKFTISGKLAGYYAEVSKSPSGTKQSWFGKDLLYVNISKANNGTDKNLFDGTGIQFKLLYKTNSANISLHDSTASSSVGVTEYNFLYTDNGTFSHSSNFLGYLTVVPVNATKIQAARCSNSSTNWQTTYNWMNADCTYDSGNHNLVLTHWSGTAPNNIAYTYNNSIGSTWPKIPDVWYP